MHTHAAVGSGVLAQPLDDGVVDYRALYFQEAEKNKQLLQWIVQLQPNLSMRLQMSVPSTASDTVMAPAKPATAAGAMQPSAREAQRTSHGSSVKLPASASRNDIARSWSVTRVVELGDSRVSSRIAWRVEHKTAVAGHPTG